MNKNKSKWILSAVALGLMIAGALIFFISERSVISASPSDSQETAGYQVVTVHVTGDGFVSEPIELHAGKPAKINFIKDTSFTCIKSAESQELGFDVYFNKGNNYVTLDDLKPGTYEFHCGMYMYYGKITVI